MKQKWWFSRRPIFHLLAFIVVFAFIGLGLLVASRATTPHAQGDLNDDGAVDVYDLGILLSVYNQASTVNDLSQDGVVDIVDLGILLFNYNKTNLSPLFVALNGTDTNLGTKAAPFRTIDKAAQVVKPGQTVYVRGGTYNDTHVFIRTAGTASAPITFAGYPGEKVIIDGGPTITSPLLYIVSSAYVTVQDMEVRNAKARGVYVYDGNHVTIQNTEVHHTVSVPMGGHGDYLTFQNNEIYDGVLSNENNAIGPNGGWGAGLATWAKLDGTRSTHIDFINNTVHDMWGECVTPFHVNFGRISGNRVYNCFSVDIYLDNVSDLFVDKNYLYETDASHRRAGRPANGIFMGNETYTVGEQNTPDQNYVITNNIITHASTGFGFWVETARTTANTYRNVKFYNNTMSDVVAGVSLRPVMASQELPSGNEIKNNIIEGTLLIGDPSGTVLSNNNFVGSTGMGSNIFTFTPGFLNKLSLNDPAGFKLSATSPLISKGLNLSSVSNDFWNTARRSPPTIGAHEP